MSKFKTFLYKVKKGRLAYLFILPLLIGSIGFCYYPAISGIITSLFNWNGTGNKEVIGFTNYKNLFHDQIFLDSIKKMIRQ